MINIISQTFGKAFVMAQMEVKKLLHDPAELVTRAVQPALWLGVFGMAMSKVRAIPTNGASYLEFITPGILAQSVIFIAIFYGLSIIWEKDMGTLQKILVTPTPRISLVWGKMLSAGVRGLSQTIVVFLLTLILGIPLKITFISVVGVVLLVLLGGALFSGVSMIIASLVKTRERFMGIGQVITLPLFFASNAIYPIEIMPGWLQVVAKVNPLSYMVDGLRGLLVVGTVPNLLLDFFVMVGVTLFISILCAYMYPKVVA